eukprot:CAMPEP_0206507088 /NCGR_PEP_ID=MMETSP0324_2-20121206/57277_1 /ASSEMBLY_ACC=CAM_ASM_000836 /TAXON_ID=2866 /ORGANISM="Crypthecodinium cohnii, Strain Seligo" /LENGTH=166 /DNA_ID=CAMNT_0053997191 /DNA_START=65 /DNA_END=566 /DNA_ORIENTATION=+
MRQAQNSQLLAEAQRSTLRSEAVSPWRKGAMSAEAVWVLSLELLSRLPALRRPSWLWSALGCSGLPSSSGIEAKSRRLTVPAATSNILRRSRAGSFKCCWRGLRKKPVERSPQQGPEQEGGERYERAQKSASWGSLVFQGGRSLEQPTQIGRQLEMSAPQAGQPGT